MSNSKFIPMASHSTRYPHWFNGNIRHQLNIARSLRKKVKKQPSVFNSSMLERLEANLQRDILSAKNQFESDLVHKSGFDNNSRLFQYIKKSLKEQSLPDILYLGPLSEGSDLGKASLFNQYFHSVFSTSRPTPDPSTLPPPASIMCDLEISIQDVFVGLSSLNVGKASGIDNIPPIVIKSCATALCGPIHHLFVQCISQAYIPQEWKTHYITPIFKSGDKASVKNYRPISLLPILSKVLERIVFDQIYDHITSLTICSKQFGFLRGRSTVQQLLVHLDSLINSLSDGSQSDVVYLDIRKAFDSVSHDILLAKLWSAGLCGLTWKFFVAYLYGRLQCVHVGTSVSNLLPVTSGVPQGSILGPLLFILYINDLPTTPLHTSLLLFADDSKCHKVVRSAQDCQLLQSDLGLLCDWSRATSLTFNSNKSCVVSYHLPRSVPVIFDYCLDGQSIDHARTCKDLGVVFTDTLTWSTQVDTVLKKAYNTLRMIKRVFPGATTPTHLKRKLYLSLVIPILTYCAPVWRPSLIKDITSLEKLQRRATKYIMFDFQLDYKSRLTALKLLPLMYRFEYIEVVFFFVQLQHRDSHFDILNYFSFSSSSTRNSSYNKLVHSSLTRSSARHTFFHRFPRLWNSLPPVNLSLSVSRFKKFVTKYFIHKLIVDFNPANAHTFHTVCPCNICSCNPLPSSFLSPS